MATCEDCFEEFKQQKDETICIKCICDYNEYVDKYVHMFKKHCSAGFKTQKELNNYKSIKLQYKKLTCWDFPHIKEIVKD